MLCSKLPNDTGLSSIVGIINHTYRRQLYFKSKYRSISVSWDSTCIHAYARAWPKPSGRWNWTLNNDSIVNPIKYYVMTLASSHKTMLKYLFPKENLRFTIYYGIVQMIHAPFGHRTNDRMHERTQLAGPFARCVRIMISLALDNQNKLWINGWTFSFLFGQYCCCFGHAFTIGYMMNEQTKNAEKKKKVD